MLEYIFFNQAPFDRFIAYLRERGIALRSEVGDEGWLVAVPEDLDDALSEAIETLYDRLLDDDRELVEAGDDGDTPDEYAGAGVSVELSDGRRVYADVEPALLLKISHCLSSDELSDFISAICDAVEHPDERTFCQRMRDQQSGK